MYHTKTKHIELDIHLINEKVQVNQNIVRFVPSADQIADIHTKALTCGQFSLSQNQAEHSSWTIHSA